MANNRVYTVFKEMPQRGKLQSSRLKRPPPSKGSYLTLVRLPFMPIYAPKYNFLVLLIYQGNQPLKKFRTVDTNMIMRYRLT